MILACVRLERSSLRTCLLLEDSLAQARACDANDIATARSLREETCGFLGRHSQARAVANAVALSEMRIPELPAVEPGLLHIGAESFNLRNALFDLVDAGAVHNLERVRRARGK
jgi:hypothetical protein